MAVTTTVAKPISSDSREPKTSREKMSRPKLSVPNQLAKLAGLKPLRARISIGSWVTRTLAKIAIRSMAAKRMMPVMNSRCAMRRSSTPGCFRAVLQSALLRGARTAWSVIAHPRVCPGVEHVDDQIEKHEGGRGPPEPALADRVVAAEERSPD